MQVAVVDDEPQTGSVPASVPRLRVDLAATVIDATESTGRDTNELLLLTLMVPRASCFELMDKLGGDARAIGSVIFFTTQEEHTIADCEKRGTISPNSAKLLEVLPLRLPIERPKANKIGIKAKDRILFIDPKEVISVHAEGNYVLFQKSSGSHLLRATISEMVSKLEPYGFIRIHRSLLVNTLFVEEIRPYSTGDYGLRIRGGKQYRVSRTYKRNLRLLANCWVGTDTFLCE